MQKVELHTKVCSEQVSPAFGNTMALNEQQDKMPLRAYIDNEEIISIDQDERQWEDLKKRLKSKECVLTLPCCKQDGTAHLRET